MKRIFAAAFSALLLLAAPARADDTPVVVELFTSQGCSSCPPADELLAELGTWDNVIALALHVDYWDYIGWEDSFAQPAFTTRQKAYASVAGRRSIYTPQMIINGSYDVIGNRPMDVVALIERERDRPMPVALTLMREGDMLAIAAEAATPVGPVDIQLVRYAPHRKVDVLRGENGGHALSYSHVVTEWRRVGSWDGAGRFEMQVPLEDGERPVVVLAQGQNYGPILGAARKK